MRARNNTASDRGRQLLVTMTTRRLAHCRHLPPPTLRHPRLHQFSAAPNIQDIPRDPADSGSSRNPSRHYDLPLCCSKCSPALDQSPQTMTGRKRHPLACCRVTANPSPSPEERVILNPTPDPQHQRDERLQKGRFMHSACITILSHSLVFLWCACGSGAALNSPSIVADSLVSLRPGPWPAKAFVLVYVKVGASFQCSDGYRCRFSG